MSDPNEHIEEFLKYYFELKNPPHYAVLLKGKWGVGKTWFLKRFLENLENPDPAIKTHLYVSLYGVSSFEDIEDEFFRQLHPVLSSKGMLLAGKVAKGFMKGVLKFDYDGDGKSDGSLSAQAPELNLPDYLSNTSSLVLIFDDLERASMDIEALLGYINHYVEHQDYKVVILANEEELLDIKKKDKSYSINSGYRRIKEKLIGKTFEIQSRLELAIESFIEEIDDQDTKVFFNSNFELINDLYERSNYRNLRHLKQALMDYARLLDSISEEIKQTEGVIKDLLSIYLILSFEIKSGTMLPDDIIQLDPYYLIDFETPDENVNDKEQNQLYKKLQDKYPSFNRADILLERKLWIDIFNKGVIDIDKVEESLKNSHYFLNVNQPEWVQLWHYIYLNDEEFKEKLEVVQKRFEKNKYRDLGEIKHVAGLFIEFSKSNLLNTTTQDVLNTAKSNIDALVTENIEIPNYDYDESSYSLGYYRKNSKEFRELIEYIKSKSKQQVLDSLPLIAEELLKDVRTNPSNFSDKLYYNGKANKYNQHPILTYIKPNEFAKALLQIDPYARRDVILAISSRYKSLGDKQQVLPEIAWLQKVVQLLLDEANQRQGTISSYQIKILTNAYLIASIKRLHQDNPNNRRAKNYLWKLAQNVEIAKTVSFFR